MSNLVFWQTIGAVVVGNTFCGLTLLMIWRATKWEKGRAPRPPAWVYFAGAIAPLVAAFSAYTLP